MNHLCRERYRTRSFKGQTETSEHSQVGVKPYTFQAAHAKRGEPL
jgi:hypothetical protein